MKIYVAGKWEERNICKGVMAALEDSGCKITHDWTASDEKENLAQSALDDINGVKNADVLVFIAIEGHHYRGSFVEMGAALALGKPVIVVGAATDVETCIFINHPLVTRVDGLGDIIPCLKNMMLKRHL